MSGAPPVRFAVVRSRGCLLLILGVATVGLVCAAAMGAMPSAPRYALMALVTGVPATLVLALWGWWCSACGVLRWDAERWYWSAAGTDADAAQPCTVRLHLDFQSLLLVSVQAQSAARLWLWLEQRSAARQWLALRRALTVSGLPDVSALDEEPRRGA